MRRLPFRSIFFSSIFLLFALRINAQNPPPTANTYVPAEVPNSVAGLQAQVDELIRIGRMHDQATWDVALGTFALPNSGAWVEENFAPPNVAHLTEDYAKVRDGHLGHISSVLGHNVDAPGFAIKVEPSEMHAPPSNEGEESQLPVPLRSIAVQNFRLTPIADSGTMPASWVSSFVYVDGHFRVVGGTYPFWIEELQRVRRPTTVDLHGAVQGPHLIHKVAPKYPKEARKKYVEGVIRLHAIIGKDGAPHDIELVSGDPLLVGAAIKAVQQWRYAPATLNGQPMEMDATIDVIFQLNR